MSGADGDALVLGERHPLLRVHDESYPGRVPRQRRVVVLVDVQDQLQPCDHSTGGQRHTQALILFIDYW